MGHLALSLMGPFRATLDGHPTEGLGSDRLRSLLAYLAVEGRREHAREQVAALLWPERSDREALRALRFALSRLHDALGDREAASPFLLVTRNTVQFNPAGDHWLDVAEFEALAQTRDVQCLERAVTLYRGPFMEGVSAGDSPALEDWLLLRTEGYRWTMLSVLGNLAALQLSRGAYGEAARWARKQLELEPYREQAHRQLMMALALDGDRATALVAYEACRRLLLQELGCEPEDETRALCDQIRASTLTPPHLPAPLVRPSSPGRQTPAAPGTTRVPPRVVAREHELSRLNTMLTQALAGLGAIALVTGEAGSGKTTLLDAYARRAEQAHSDLIVLRGSCNTHGRAGDPYLPFREILQTLAGDVEGKRAGGALSPEQVRRLWEALPITGAALVTHGPNLLENLVPGRALLQRAEGFPLAGGGQWKVRLRELVGRAEARAEAGAVAPLPVRGSGLSPVPAPQVDLFAQVTQVLHTVSQSRPLLLVIDDMQWADASTAALLFHLSRRLRGSRVLIACACRPEALALEEREADPSSGSDAGTPNVGTVLHELCREWGDVMIDLDQVDGRAFVEAYVDAMPNQLGTDFRQALYEHTAGNPLFTVELLHSFERDGTLVQDRSGRWVEGGPLNWERWPPQVEAVITGHMAGLAGEERALLQAAGVQGETFIAEVVARVLGWREEDVIHRLSGSLRSRHRLVEAVSLDRLGVTGQRLSRYRFRHVLLQMGAYGSLDAIEQALLHEATAGAIESIYAAAGEPLRGVASELARHYEAASMPWQAARHRLTAGRWAARLAASEEALTHLQRGLALLDEVAPSLERRHLELALWVAVTNPAALQGGWHAPVFRQALAHLATLAQDPALADDPLRRVAQMMLVLVDTWLADPENGRRGGERLLALATEVDPRWLMPAHWTLGNSAWSRGDLAAARKHLALAVTLYNRDATMDLSPMLGADPGVMAHSLLGYVLFQQGYIDQGSAETERALAEAESLGHVPTKAFARVVAGTTALLFERDAAAARRHANVIRSLGDIAGFYWRFVAMLTGDEPTRNAELAGDGAGSDGAVASIGPEVGQAAMLLARARMLAQGGRPDAALQLLIRATEWIEQTGVRVTEAEVWRLRGELLLATAPSAPPDEGERCLKQALAVAQAQGSRWFELRAAVSLARLWRVQGRTDAARALLQPVYAWFTEGHDRADLREAQALLQALAAAEAA